MAGSSIHGCNICGKEGHQAAHCPNGTVGWENKWPREAFQLEEPQWYEEPNYEVVAKVARQWADKRRRQLAAGGAADEAAAAADGAVAGGDDAQASKGVEEGGAHANGDAAAAHPGVDGGAGAQAQVPPPQAAAAANTWQTYFDTLGRPYYFQAATNTTVWSLPPGAVALPGVPPPGVTVQQQQPQQPGAGGVAQAGQTVGA